MMKMDLQLFGGRGSGGSRGGGGSKKIDSKSWSTLIRTEPYGNARSSEIDAMLSDELGSTAKNFDSNINPYYSRTENTIYMGISSSPIPREAYDLSTKSGNQFKAQMTEKLSSLGLEVEKSGKRKSGGSSEYWFRIR